MFITWQMMGSPYEAYPNTLTLNGGQRFPEAPVPAGLATPSLTAEDRKISVRWSPPTTNASSVSKYRVTNALNGQQVCENDANNLGCTFEGLADGPYAFQVSAVNSFGKGATSQPTPIVRVGLPSAPVITRVESWGTRVILRWSVASDTTAVPRIYRVHDSQGSEVCGVAVTSVEIAAGSMTCSPTIAAGASTQYVVTLESALGSIPSGPTPTVTGIDASKSPQCRKAKFQLKKVSKAGSKLLIVKAKKQVRGACIPQVAVY